MHDWNADRLRSTLRLYLLADAGLVPADRLPLVVAGQAEDAFEVEGVFRTMSDQATGRMAEAADGRMAHRLDHYQVLIPDVRKATEFYMAAGFRLSEYIAPASGELLGVFLQRKGNPHDLVFFKGPGPRFHHVAFTAPESFNILRACDVAGTLGFGTGVERGPGRHGPGHALFVYMRDPDGYRIELFNTHYQVMDIENEPMRWDASQSMKRRWQLPARQQWFAEASPFAGVELREPARKGDPMSLEKFIAAGMR